MRAIVWVIWAVVVTVILVAIAREIRRANGRGDAVRALRSARTLRDALIAAVIAVVPTLGGGPALLGPAAFLGAVLGAGVSVLAQLWAMRRRAKLEAFARERGLELWRSQRPSGWARSDDALAELIGDGPDQRPSQAPGTDDLLAALAAMIGPTTSIETLASGSISGHPALVADVCWFRRRFSAVWLDVRRDEEMIAGAEAEPAARRLLGLPARVADDRDLLARIGPEGVLAVRPRDVVDELGLAELTTLAVDVGRAAEAWAWTAPGADPFSRPPSAWARVT